MEPIIEFSGASITLVEILIAALLILVSVGLTWVFARRDGREETQLQNYMSKMREDQTRLQGRLEQFADDSAQRDAVFRDNLDKRLNSVSERVGKSLEHSQTKTGENLSRLHERLGLIDQAQNNIKTLAGEVSGLQSILSNKQARGAFGEKQMQDLIQNFLPSRAYAFQEKLSNNKIVDALIYMPDGHGDVAIDSKFPLESWRNMVTAENVHEVAQAAQSFRADMKRHIFDISKKYILPGETYELALLFLPSEAIFSELHTNFEAVVDEAFHRRVIIVSPTTFMATLHVMQSVMNDADVQKNAALIQSEVAKMAKDVGRLGERVDKLQQHFSLVNKDVKDIKISTSKITKQADKISKVEFDTENEALESAGPTLKLVEDEDGSAA